MRRLQGRVLASHVSILQIFMGRSVDAHQLDPLFACRSARNPLALLVSVAFTWLVSCDSAMALGKSCSLLLAWSHADHLVWVIPSILGSCNQVAAVAFARQSAQANLEAGALPSSASHHFLRSASMSMSRRRIVSRCSGRMRVFGYGRELGDLC